MLRTQINILSIIHTIELTLKTLNIKMIAQLRRLKVFSFLFSFHTRRLTDAVAELNYLNSIRLVKRCSVILSAVFMLAVWQLIRHYIAEANCLTIITVEYIILITDYSRIDNYAYSIDHTIHEIIILYEFCDSISSLDTNCTTHVGQHLNQA